LDAKTAPQGVTIARDFTDYIFSFPTIDPRRVWLRMANRVPPFPLWEVLTAPAVVRLSPTAIGHLVLLLGALWASGDMTLPTPQAAVQALARAGDAAWARNREKMLTAYHALAPDLACALARGQRIIAVRQAGAASARAGKARHRLMQAPGADRFSQFAPQSAAGMSLIPRTLPQSPHPSPGRGHTGGPYGSGSRLRD